MRQEDEEAEESREILRTSADPADHPRGSKKMRAAARRKIAAGANNNASLRPERGGKEDREEPRGKGEGSGLLRRQEDSWEALLPSENSSESSEGAPYNFYSLGDLPPAERRPRRVHSLCRCCLKRLSIEPVAGN